MTIYDFLPIVIFWSVGVAAIFVLMTETDSLDLFLKLRVIFAWGIVALILILVTFALHIVLKILEYILYA